FRALKAVLVLFPYTSSRTFRVVFSAERVSYESNRDKPKKNRLCLPNKRQIQHMESQLERVPRPLLTVFVPLSGRSGIEASRFSTMLHRPRYQAGSLLRSIS